jgi:hypothetical protein
MTNSSRHRTSNRARADVNALRKKAEEKSKLQAPAP